MEPFEIPGHGGGLSCVLHGEASAARSCFPAPPSGERLDGSPARPDLHFTRVLLQEHGLSVTRALVGHGHARPRRRRRLAACPRTRRVRRDRGARPGAGAARGRSLGTVALALLRTERRGGGTPSERLDRAARASRGRAHVAAAQTAAGDSSSPAAPTTAYDPGLTPLLEQRGADVVVLDGADHALDCGGAVASARALAASARAHARRSSCANARAATAPRGAAAPREAGSHQFQRPSTAISEGTSSARTIVASTRTASERPTPSCWSAETRPDDEAGEGGDHDRGGGGDDPARPLESVRDGLARCRGRRPTLSRIRETMKTS